MSDTIRDLGIGDVQIEASRLRPGALPARSTTERPSIRSSPMVQLRIAPTSQIINELRNIFSSETLLLTVKKGT
jgi:hypothetical protein